MSARPEDDLLDPSLQSDIELFGSLVAAVSDAGRRLTLPEIDTALGVAAEVEAPTPLAQPAPAS